MLLPFVTPTSGYVAAPGTIILAAGMLLVVMSAFFDSTHGVGNVPGWRFSFGHTEDAESESEKGSNADSSNS